MNLMQIIKENKSMKFRIGLATIGAVLIGIVFYIVSSLVSPNTPPLISLPNRVASPTPTPIRSEMYSQPLSIETTVGRQFEVNIVIDAKNTVINGVDSVITYDPAILRVTRVNAAPNESPLAILGRTIEEGKVVITTAKTEVDDTPTQELVVATLSIRALKSGTATLMFEHRPNTTTGSTVIKAEGSENILDKVTNTTVIIK